MTKRPDGTYQNVGSLPNTGAAGGTARIHKQNNPSPFQQEQLRRERQDKQDIDDRAARRENDKGSGV